MDTLSELERRQHSRYPASQIKVLIKSLRSPGTGWAAGLISTVDFNRFGIGLDTEQNYAVGDILKMIIRTDDATLAEVNGLVCNRSQTALGYRLGVRFEHDDDEADEGSEAMINISEEILMIEQQAAGMMH